MKIYIDFDYKNFILYDNLNLDLRVTDTRPRLRVSTSELQPTSFRILGLITQTIVGSISSESHRKGS